MIRGSGFTRERPKGGAHVNAIEVLHLFSGLGFGVWGFDFNDLGFRVKGSGFRV